MTYRLQTPQLLLLKHLTVQQTNIDIGYITTSCRITGEERKRSRVVLSPRWSLQKIPELVTSLNFQIASAHTSIQH